ncbi:MAG: PIN domain-containing protein [Acidobacteriota bacterium]|nr:PIN domain-containing protein [Acidobacteriota bacterium]
MTPSLYFLDTNILVHLVRRDDLGQYINAQFSLLTTDTQPMISDVSEGELRSLAIQWGWKKNKLEQMEFILSCFLRVAIGDSLILKTYAAIDAHSQAIGNSMGKNDIWIAASAKSVGATLLTTDKDFDHLNNLFITRVWIDPERDKKLSVN